MALLAQRRSASNANASKAKSPHSQHGSDNHAHTSASRDSGNKNSPEQSRRHSKSRPESRSGVGLRIRTAAIAAAAFAMLAIAVLATSTLSNTRTASAFTHLADDTYDLCTRTAEIKDAILIELREWGAAQSPPVTTYDGNFGRCGTGETALISATHLRDRAVTTYSTDPLGGPAGLGSNVMSIKPGDFAGLNIGYLLMRWTNIKELPARVFADVPIGRLEIESTPNLEKVHPDTFKGMIVPDAGNFVLYLRGASKLTADDIPPTLFDPIGDQSFANTAKTVDWFVLGGPNINHINTRWFASLGMTGIVSWAAIDLNDSNPKAVYDTYYYQDGDDGRFTDGSKTTPGEVSIQSTTTKATIGTAISNEMQRWATANKPGTFTIGATPNPTTRVVKDFSQGADNAGNLRVDRTRWGSVDLCVRTPFVGGKIISELRAEQPTIYGTEADHTSGSYAISAGFGCGNNESAIVTKANLTAHTDWGTNATQLNLAGGALTKLRFDDFRYLDVEDITFNTSHTIEQLPDGIYRGLPLKIIRMNNIGIRKMQSRLFEGIQGSAIEVLGISDNRHLRDTGVDADVFDPLTNLRYLDWNNGPGQGSLGRINTRWFKELDNLGNGAGWYRLNFDGQAVTSHFYNDTGGYYDTGATLKVDYDPSDANAGATLRTAIETASGNPATLDISATNKFLAPDEWGIDICGRNEAVWKEVMRQFYVIRTDVPDYAAPGDYWIHYSPAGDIRFDRYNDITVSDCEVLQAEWVNQETGVRIADQTAFNTSDHALSIRNDANNNSHGQHRNVFRLDGADLSTLTAADFRNFFDVRKLWLNGTGLENVPAGLFSHMPKLTDLYLNNNKLDNADFTGSSNFLAPLNNLQVLQLGDNLLTRFNSSWLTSGSRSSLKQLWLDANPLIRTDLSGITGLTHLGLARSNITEFDPAITQMSNLQHFWWWELRAMPAETVADFLPSLPASIQLSIPGGRLGNLGDLEDRDIDAAATALQIAHNARLRAIDSAAGNNQVTHPQLQDPCRPLVEEAGGRTEWADAEVWGPLCLTSAQKDAWISSLDSYNAGSHFLVRNTDFTDAQMAAFLNKLAGQDNVYGIQVAGNPNAFGAGFSDSALAAFREFDDLWLLRLKHHDLTFAQADTIMDHLAYALGTDIYSATIWDGTMESRRGGLTILDLSYNPLLFKQADGTTDVAADDLHDFLTGIFSSKEPGVRLRLNLASTGLNFDQLEAIIWSIGQGSTPTDISRIATLNISDNPNVFRRFSSGSWDDVPVAEVTALLGRLDGLQNFYAGNTGLTSDAKLAAVFAGLDLNPMTDKTIDPRDTSSLTRLNQISLAGNDLSGITSFVPFESFMGRNALQAAPLTHIWLGETSINLADLTAIADALASADLLEGVTNLDLSGNPDIFQSASCPDGTLVNDLSSQLRRFTNLRNLDVSDNAITFTVLKCVIHGLNAGDGTSTDDVAASATVLNLRDNPDLFKKPEMPGSATLVDATSAEVATALLPLRNARTNLANTGFTVSLATAVAQARTAGLDEDETRELLEAFANQNPAPGLTFETPLPDGLKLESGRGSMQLSFTHDHTDNILRYEFRYRALPSDTTEPWLATGTQAWRTLSVELDESGDFEHKIFGLEPETTYQLQFRAISVGRPNTITLEQGTTIRLPEVNEILPAITEINMRAGDQVRLEVNIKGLADILDNNLYDNKPESSQLMFRWNEKDGNDVTRLLPGSGRRVTYTAPALPGTYFIIAEAQPDGICNDHHNTDFGISDADREACQATFTVRVSRAQIQPEAAPDPVNPAGPIPSSLTDSVGIAYEVFTPVEGGTFTGEGISVSAAAGAVPDQTLIGVSAAESAIDAPEATPGAQMTIANPLFDILGVSANGEAVDGFRLDDPLNACLPLPEVFRANISDIVLVEAKVDGSYGILSSKLTQNASGLSVCGAVSTLPTTVGVAKLGVVVAPPAPVDPIDPETPETGATAPSSGIAQGTLAAGALLLLLAGAGAVAGAVLSRRRSRKDARG